MRGCDGGCRGGRGDVVTRRHCSAGDDDATGDTTATRRPRRLPAGGEDVPGDTW